MNFKKNLAIAITSAALAGSALTACSNDSNAAGGVDEPSYDGTWYHAYGDNNDSFQGKLVIKGAVVEYYAFDCDGDKAIVEAKAAATGTLSQAGTQINWGPGSTIETSYKDDDLSGKAQQITFGSDRETFVLDTGDRYEFVAVADADQALATFNEQC